MNLLNRMLGKPEPREEHHTPEGVAIARFQWDEDCFIQQSLRVDQLPREGETVTVLTQYASIEGTVTKVRRVYTETEPSPEYLTGERTGDKGTFFRSRLSRAIITLQDVRMPSPTEHPREVVK